LKCSQSYICCCCSKPLNGILTLSNFAFVTAAFAIFAVVTLTAIFAVVTLASAILIVVTASAAISAARIVPSKIFAVVTASQ
jgi:hypothetical protein